MSKPILLLIAIIALVLLALLAAFLLFTAPLQNLLHFGPAPDEPVRGFIDALNQGQVEKAQAFVCDEFDLLSTPLSNFVVNPQYKILSKDEKTAEVHVEADLAFGFIGDTFKEHLALVVATTRGREKWCLNAESAQALTDELFQPKTIVSGFFNTLNSGKSGAALEFVCETMVLPELPNDFLFNSRYQVTEQNSDPARVRVQAQVRGEFGPFVLPVILDEIKNVLPPWLRGLPVAIHLNKNVDFIATTVRPRGRWCMTRESVWHFLIALLDPTK